MGAQHSNGQTPNGPHSNGNRDHAVARAVDGDKAALEGLLREHVPAICKQLSIDARWSRSFDRDDLAQITCIEAILRVQTLRTQTVAGFRAWVKRIAENNLRDAIRGLDCQKRSPAERRVTRCDDGRSARTLLNALEGDTPTASAIFGGAEDITRLETALTRLPATYRHVVECLDLDEQKLADVAADLGRSQGAIHMLHARAHARLRELLVG